MKVIKDEKGQSRVMADYRILDCCGTFGDGQGGQVELMVYEHEWYMHVAKLLDSYSPVEGDNCRAIQADNDG